MRVLHVTDRLSERGGADLDLLGVLGRTRAEVEPAIAVGRRDGTAAAPCPVTEVRGLAKSIRASVSAELDTLADELRPDVVHIHNAVNPEALEWAAGRGAIATVQDHRSFCPGRGKLTLDGQVCREPMSPDLCAGCFEDDDYFRRIYARTEERLRALRDMARITVLSQYMRTELASVGVAAERIEVIPPFVHGLDPAAEPDGAPCVLYAGRLVTAKGVHDAAEAWRRAAIDLPLVFAGTGTERGHLEDRGFEVLGWLPHERMSGVYRRASAVLMPSRWQEPFGISGLEALTMGVPVAAWDSGGVREWLPTAVAWGDLDGLAAALVEAIELGEACAPPGFEREPLVARLLELYREVAG
jgi:glycosyltransferase involved in cell wall biosynthesis